jgi:hypothetical protein
MYHEDVLLLVLIHLKCMSKELLLLNYSKKYLVIIIMHV